MSPAASESSIIVTVRRNLTIGFGDTFEFVFAFDGKRCRRALGSVDQLVGKTLGDGLHRTKGRVASACADQIESLVDASER